MVHDVSSFTKPTLTPSSGRVDEFEPERGCTGPYAVEEEEEEEEEEEDDEEALILTMTRRKRTRKRTKPLVASWEEVEVRSVVGERVGILWLLGTMMMMMTTVGGKGSAVSSGGVEIANHHTHDHIILFHHPNPRKTGSATRTPHTTYTSRCDGLKASYSMTR